MSASTSFRVTGIVAVAFAVLNCGSEGDPDLERQGTPTTTAALTAAQVAAARQAGLIPSGYVQPQFFEPVGNYSVTSADYTTANRISNSGVVVGFTQRCTPRAASGCLSSPFYIDSAGQQHLLPNPQGSSGHALDINQTGDIAGQGGPGGGDFNRPIVYHANAPHDLLPTLTSAGTGALVRAGPVAINNVMGEWDGPGAVRLPAMAANAVYLRGGAIGAWRFDNDGLDVLNRLPLTLPANQPFDNSGPRGAGLLLDGNTCIQRGADDTTSPYYGAGMTMMAWVKPDPTMCAGGGTRVIVGRQYGYILSLTCNATGGASVSGQVLVGSSTVLPPAGNIPLGAWSHVAVSGDGGVVRAFIDGVQVAQVAPGTTAAPWHNSFAVGCRPGAPSTNYKGVLDELAVFDIPMAADQIALYKQGLLGYRVSSQANHQMWARYKDGALDVLQGPVDSAYNGSGFAADMNDQGQMVGFQYLASGAPSAVLYDPTAGWTNLNQLIPPDSGWNLESAVALNDQGQIVGNGSHDGRHAAFRLDLGTREIIDLQHLTEGNFPDPARYIIAHDVNAKGHVAGAVYDTQAVWPERAVIYTDELGLTDLNSLIDPALLGGWVLLVARGINDNDEVVGLARNAAGQYRGFKMKVPIVGTPAAATAADPVAPTVVCTAALAGGKSRAIFGYLNSQPTNQRIEMGDRNKILVNGQPTSSPLPPTWFSPGQKLVAFVIEYPTAGSASWRLGSQTKSSTDGSACELEQGPGGLVAVVGPRLPGFPQFDQRIPVVPNREFVFRDTIADTETEYSTAEAAADSVLESPIGPRAAGALPGSFAVTDDGAASYDIPIEIPQGRAGLQPSLRLVYNSRGPDGPMGPGWSLAGLSRIMRCETTRAVAIERSLSGEIGETAEAHPVRFNPSDELCMDGERMIRSGGSLSFPEFRTQRDTFSKIVVSGSSDGLGATQFTVYRKNGLIELYGSNTSSRVDSSRTVVDTIAPGPPSPRVEPIRAGWYLSQVTDRYGNSVSITYNDGLTLRTNVYPKEIRYTANAQTGRTANRAVKFNYVTRPEGAGPTYFAGWRRNRTELLTAIDITGPNPVNEGLVRRYRLTYTRPSLTGRSLLTRVQVCDGAGRCQAPTEFSWERGGTRYVNHDTTVSDVVNTFDYGDIEGFENQSRVLTGADLDGDGRDDLIYRKAIPQTTNAGNLGNPAFDATYLYRLSNGVTFLGATALGVAPMTRDQWTMVPYGIRPFLQVADLNLDGLADGLIRRTLSDDPFGASVFDLYTSNGAGLSRLPLGVVEPAFLDPATNPEYTRPVGGTSPVIADFNGDGWPDELRQLLRGQLDFRLGIRFGSPTGLGTVVSVIASIDGAPADELPSGGMVPLDADGDGKTEILISPPGTEYFSLVTFSRAGVPKVVNTNLFHTNQYFVKPIDVNGDGLRDVMMTSLNGTNVNYSFKFNTGAGAFVDGPDVTPQMIQSQPVDVDGDGLEDLLYLSCPQPGRPYAHPTAYLSNGDGTFDTTELTDIPPALGLRLNPSTNNCVATVMDIDGNGMADIVQAESAGQPLHVYLNDNRPPDKLIGITDGLGKNTRVEYAAPAFSRTNCSFPFSCAQRKIHVVAAYDVDVGSDDGSARNRFELSYSDPRTDILGRGWLGFVSRVERNMQTGAVRTLTFADRNPVRTLYPLAGLRKFDSSRVTLASGRTVFRDRSILDFTYVGGDPELGTPFAVRPALIEEREYEYGPGESIDLPHPQRYMSTRLTYDGFGNVLTRRVSSFSANRASRTVELTTNRYSTNSQSWLVSTPLSTEVASTAPDGTTRTRRTEFVPDPATGLVRHILTEPAGPPSERLTTEIEPDIEGNAIRVTRTDATGEARTERYTYDAVDGTFPASFTNAAGHVSHMAIHGGLGVLAELDDPNGVQTRFIYDGLGRLRAQESIDGSGISLHYLRNFDGRGGYRVTSDKLGGGSSSVAYDRLGREIARGSMASDGQSRSTRVAYDPVTGQMASITRPSQLVGAQTLFQYDRLGRLLSVDVPGRQQVRREYLGLLTSLFRGGARLGTVEEDEMGRPVVATSFPEAGNPGHAVRTTTVYGPFGLAEHIFNEGDGQRLETVLQYDGRGRRVRMQDPDTGLRKTGYNGFGDVIREVDALSRETLLVPDSLGRLVTAHHQGKVDVLEWDVAAGGLGRLAASISASAVVNTFQYDPRGRQTAMTMLIDGRSYTVGQRWDAQSRIDQITYPGVTTGSPLAVNFGFDADDGDVSSVDATAGVGAIWSKQTLSDAGEIEQELLGGALTSIRHRDPANGALRHIAVGTGSIVAAPSGFAEPQSAVQSLTYQYEPSGRLQTRDDWKLNLHESFTYDDLDRLKTWQLGTTAVTYDYSDLGNLRRRLLANGTTTQDESYTYGERGAGPHALTTAPWGTYDYDLDGRQTTRPGQSIPAYTRFDLPEQLQQAGGTTSFTYDALGTRVAKRAPSTTTYYVGALYERRQTGATVSHVFYLPGPGRVVGQIVCTGPDGSATCAPPSYLHEDLLGSIDTVTAAGGGVTRIKHDPYGRYFDPASPSSPGAGNPTGVRPGFTGEEQDDDLGLVNLNHRLYDSRLGRFISPDPLVGDPLSAQAHNRYSYALNAPTLLTDRSGLQAQEPERPEGLSPTDVWLGTGTFATTDGLGTADLWGPREDPFVSQGLAPGPTFVNIGDSSGEVLRGPGDTSSVSARQTQRDNASGGGGGLIGLAPLLLTDAYDNPLTGQPMSRDRDWLTGERGKVSIPIFGLGGMGGDPTRGLLQRLVGWIRGAPAVAVPAVGVLSHYTSDPVRLNVLKQLYQDGLRTSQTVAQQLAGSRSFIPLQSILQTVGNGMRGPDPQGIANQFMYQANAVSNGSTGVLEVLVNEKTWQVFHVLFKSGVSLQ